MKTKISKEKAKEIDDLIKKTCQSIPIDNLSITITNQEEELFSMNYGSGITDSSSFVLGSTSKAFTALAMLQLLEKFSISIDTPIRHYLPAINCNDEITIRDLLNHTSGIGTYETIDNLKFSGKYGAFEYSNANYNLIGSIIEVITGNTFSDYVETKIFTSLKMKHSFAFSDNTKPQVMQGYKTYFGFSLPYDTKVPNEYSWIQEPSGYLCSSTTDMGIFLRYMMKYSYEGNQLSKIVKENGVLVKNSPAIEDIYINNDGIYSAGWINKTVNNVDILYHTGKLSNFCSFSALIPDKQLGISIACNFGDFLVGTNQIEHLYEGITSILIDKDITNSINPYDYFTKHSVINFVLLILLMLCSLPFILYYFYSVITTLNIANGMILIFVHFVIPYILFNIFSFIGISREAMVDFAPDIVLVFSTGSIILFIAGLWKINTLLQLYRGVIS
ncbi:MAG: serine hydrolase [Hespellia sp.]|nr:serine hydrolase [Hespellia sp.]